VTATTDPTHETTTAEALMLRLLTSRQCLLPGDAERLLAELRSVDRGVALAEAISAAQSAPTPDCSNFSSLNDAFNGGQSVAVQAIRELAGDVDEASCATCSHDEDFHYPDCMHIACDCSAFVRRDANKGKPDVS
jgi:hypothetical protein